MTAQPFVEAIYNLRIALTAPEVVGPDDEIIVEIPLEAGHRLERWLVMNPPEELVYRGHHDWCRTINVDTDKPMREVQFHRVKIRWPLRRYMTPNGPAVARPFRAEDVVEIPAGTIDENLPVKLSPEMAQRRVPRFERPTGEA